MVDSQKVYELLRKIPEGKVTTYGEVARTIGSKAYRGVGMVVGQNRDIPATPCHRVVRSDGGISGYAFGVDKKVELLKGEGVEIENGKVVDFKDKFYQFSD